MNTAAHTYSKANRPALVLGLGKTGLAFTRWLERNGKTARVADTRAEPPGAAELGDGFELVLGEFDTPLLDGVERVLVSPGIPGNSPLLNEARRRSLPVLSDIDLFAAEADAPVVAVTGSNGKSTVVSLLAACLSAGGHDAAAGGNLGTPVLDMLTVKTPDWYVLELSSFQLERTAALPCRVATILNLSPDHLDWHGSFANYRRAKERIFGHADRWVVNRAMPLHQETLLRDTISFGLDKPAEGHFGIIADGDIAWLARGDEKLMPVSELSDPATHQQLNALAVLALLAAIDIAPHSALETLRTFKALPHRRECIARIDGIEYIDDSKATNTGAALASIQAAGSNVVLIAGGDSKGAELGAFVEAAIPMLSAAVLIGRAASELETLFADQLPVARAADMAAAVHLATGFASAGQQVLLAPACASTDQYADYRARGNAFRDAVGALTP